MKFEDRIRDQMIIAGTPSSVIPKLRRLLEETRPSILALWASDGFVSHRDAMTCIRLLGQEVLPALRETGKALELWSPFEANAPVSLATRRPVEDEDPRRRPGRPADAPRRLRPRRLGGSRSGPRPRAGRRGRHTSHS